MATRRMSRAFFSASRHTPCMQYSAPCRSEALYQSTKWGLMVITAVVVNGGSNSCSCRCLSLGALLRRFLLCDGTTAPSLLCGAARSLALWCCKCWRLRPLTDACIPTCCAVSGDAGVWVCSGQIQCGQAVAPVVHLRWWRGTARPPLEEVHDRLSPLLSLLRRE